MAGSAIGILEGPNYTALATAVAIGFGLRVKLNAAGTVQAAGLTEIGIGNTREEIVASGRGIVRLHNCQGEQEAIASEAIAVGDNVYTAAAGQASKTATATGFYLGCATLAASAGGKRFKYMPLPKPPVNP